MKNLNELLILKQWVNVNEHSRVKQSQCLATLTNRSCLLGMGRMLPLSVAPLHSDERVTKAMAKLSGIKSDSAAVLSKFLR